MRISDWSSDVCSSDLSALADSMTPLVRFVGAGLALALLPTVEGFLLAWAAAELVTAGAYWIILARTGDLGLPPRRPPADRRLLADNPGLVRFTLSTTTSSTPRDRKSVV